MSLKEFSTFQKSLHRIDFFFLRYLVESTSEAIWSRRVLLLLLCVFDLNFFSSNRTIQVSSSFLSELWYFVSFKEYICFI